MKRSARGGGWLLAAAVVGLAGCHTMGDVFERTVDVNVAEIRRADACGAIGSDEPKLILFPDRSAVENWQLAAPVDFVAEDNGPLPSGAYGLIQYSGAYSLAISRRATLREDGVLNLTATFLPAPTNPAAVTMSRCVLVALPAYGRLKATDLVLRDQRGVERARTQGNPPAAAAPNPVAP